MINKIRWLWKQFTGQYVTSLGVGIFKLVSQIDEALDYLNKFSLATCTDDHLTFIGALMGIPRPMTDMYPETYFWFTRQADHNSVKGFSERPQTLPGGQFTDLYDPRFTVTKQVVQYDMFKAILEVTRDVDAEVGSLRWIDAILTRFTNVEHTPYSYYHWYKQGDSPVRSEGDLEVYMGEGDTYGDKYDFIHDAITHVVNDWVNPEWNVDFNFAIEGTLVEVDYSHGMQYGYGYVEARLMKDSASVIALFHDDLRALFNNFASNAPVGHPTEAGVVATWKRPLNTDAGAVVGLECDVGYAVQAEGDGVETITIRDTLEWYQSKLKILGTKMVPTNQADGVAINAEGVSYNGQIYLSYVAKQHTVPAVQINGIELYFDGRAYYLRVMNDTSGLAICKLHYVRGNLT